MRGCARWGTLMGVLRKADHAGISGGAKGSDEDTLSSLTSSCKILASSFSDMASPALQMGDITGYWSADVMMCVLWSWKVPFISGVVAGR